MKNTENYEQLLARFTKRIVQIKGTKTTTPLELEKVNEQLHYLRGCKDTIEYLIQNGIRIGNGLTVLWGCVSSFIDKHS